MYVQHQLNLMKSEIWCWIWLMLLIFLQHWFKFSSSSLKFKHKIDLRPVIQRLDYITKYSGLTHPHTHTHIKLWGPSAFRGSSATKPIKPRWESSSTAKRAIDAWGWDFACWLHKALTILMKSTRSIASITGKEKKKKRERGRKREREWEKKRRKEREREQEDSTATQQKIN